MKIHSLIICIVLVFGSIVSAFGQIREVDRVANEIYRHGKGTSYEISTFELENGKRKLYYACPDKENTDFADIVFESSDDFDNLYAIIIDGFDKEPEYPIKIDLGDSYLYLFYEPMLIGSPMVSFTYVYKSSPYHKSKSTKISRKDIKKIFGKVLKS